MKRLYFLIPDIESATHVASDLRELGVSPDGIHVLAKEHDKIEMSKVPEAGVLQTTDIVHALAQGAVVGGVAGVVVGILALLYPPAGVILGWKTVLTLGIFGTFFGAWVSSLVGISVPNPALEKFQRAMEAGGILLIVDVERGASAKILRFMKENHPESKVHGLKLPAKL